MNADTSTKPANEGWESVDWVSSPSSLELRSLKDSFLFCRKPAVRTYSLVLFSSFSLRKKANRVPLWEKRLISEGKWTIGAISTNLASDLCSKSQSTHFIYLFTYETVYFLQNHVFKSMNFVPLFGHKKPFSQALYRSYISYRLIFIGSLLFSPTSASQTMLKIKDNSEICAICS